MTTTELTGTSASEPTSSKWMALLAKPSAARVMVVGGVLFTLLSLTRMITDGDDLTSSGTMSTTLRVTTPILLAGLAGLWAERVGIVNIGIEGMMILGTWFGGWGAWKYGPWVGLLLAVLAGCVGGLIHAFAVVRFNVNHVISGVAINLFAFGAMRYLSELVYTPDTGGGISKSPQQKGAIPRINMPFLSGGQIGGWKSPDMLGWLEKKRFFLLPDIAGVLRGLVFNVSWASVIALLMVPLSAWVLWRTRFGLRVRSSGEAPAAAETLGVKVTPLRYLALAISGGLASTLALVGSTESSSATGAPPGCSAARHCSVSRKHCSWSARRACPSCSCSWHRSAHLRPSCRWCRRRWFRPSTAHSRRRCC